MRTWFPAAARLLEKLTPEQRDLLDPGLVAMSGQGAEFTRGEIQDATIARGELGVAMQQFLSDYDLLATPSTAIPAFAAGIEHPDPAGQRWSDWAGFSYPFNLSQQPAVSVPAGFTQAGLPIGLQLVAAKYADALVLRAARAFEAASPQPMPVAPRGAVV
jgi:aspartyl-tRNA(Asn)/glutamyl-tRNA(Gln) amidotransferase subunit A